MPFTPSHAVVALPFARAPLVPAAVAVAAMAPDLPLFVRFGPLTYAHTHDFAWLPATMLLALVLLLVWRCVLRPAARESAPATIAGRLPEEWDRGALAGLRETFVGPGRGIPWRALLLLAASLAIGVASHIAWDLFTHEGRWGAQVIPALAADWGPVPGFKWLQWASGAVGLAILAVWAFGWIRRRDAAPSLSRILPSWVRWAWWASLPVALLVAWLAGLAAFGPPTARFTTAHLAYRVLPPACAAWGMLSLALAATVQALRARRR